jgi:hypothetical protein
MVEIAKAIWDRVLSGATHNIASSAGRRLRQLASNIYTDGTAQAGGANTITLAAGESAIDDIFWQSYVGIVGGTGAGQGHHILAYNGTTKVAVIDDDWIVQPDATSEYVIYGSGSHDEIMSGLAQAGANDSITLESTAHTGDDRVKDCYVVVLSGTGAHQARLITAYNGTTKVATVYPDWIVNPDATSGYSVIPIGQNNVWDQILTGSTHNITNSSGKQLREIREIGVYEGGQIWIDTLNGVAGTTNYENGTVDNPVDSIADARTLAVSLGLMRFRLAPGSGITLAASFINYEFNGNNWTLALGGQDISGSHFFGAEVSGTGVGAASADFHNCVLGTCTLNQFHATHCGFDGTITFGLAGEYLVSHCYSAVAGGATPIFDTGAGIANVNLAMPDWYNGIEIRNLNQAGVDEFSISGTGQIIYAASSSGTVHQRGDWMVTNTGGVTIIADDNTTVLGDQARSAATIQKGAAVSGTLSTTEMTTDLTVSILDQFNGRTLIFANDTITAALRGQGTEITATTVADSKLGFTALTTAPVVGDTFSVN